MSAVIRLNGKTVSSSIVRLNDRSVSNALLRLNGKTISWGAGSGTSTAKVKLTWYNPETGQSVVAGIYTSATANLTYPATFNDAVLVAEVV